MFRLLVFSFVAMSFVVNVAHAETCFQVPQAHQSDLKILIKVPSKVCIESIEKTPQGDDQSEGSAIVRYRLTFQDGRVQEATKEFPITYEVYGEDNYKPVFLTTPKYSIFGALFSAASVSEEAPSVLLSMDQYYDVKSTLVTIEVPPPYSSKVKLDYSFGYDSVYGYIKYERISD